MLTLRVLPHRQQDAPTSGHALFARARDTRDRHVVARSRFVALLSFRLRAARVAMYRVVQPS
eukprot:13613244-Alexandrium_andersonii.AAC.1